MQMDRGLDTGPIFGAESVTIAAEDDSASLHDKLAQIGARLIVTVLAQIERGGLVAQAQAANPTYAAKITKAESEIDWKDAAADIERKVRAFSPQPGASSSARGVALKIWRADVSASAGAPGAILEAGPKGVVVACGTGALVVHELQRAGGKRLPTAQFLAGFPLTRGERLELFDKNTI
jgi:methionyl-tRNA formyltransferase